MIWWSRNLINFVYFEISTNKKSYNLNLKLWFDCKVCLLMPCPSVGPKLFWTGKYILLWSGPNRFGDWSGPNHFVQVQIWLFWTNFFNLDLSKMIWTRTKQIGPVQKDWYILDQNYLDGPKSFWTCRRTRHY